MKLINTITLAEISVILIICIDAFRTKVEELKQDILNFGWQNVIVLLLILLAGFSLSVMIFMVNRKLQKKA